MIPVTFFYNSTLLTRIYFDKLVIYPKHSFVLLRLCGLYKNRVRELFGKAILMQSRPIGYGTIGNQKASDSLILLILFLHNIKSISFELFPKIFINYCGITVITSPNILIITFNPSAKCTNVPDLFPGIVFIEFLIASSTIEGMKQRPCI